MWCRSGSCPSCGAALFVKDMDIEGFISQEEVYSLRTCSKECPLRD